MIIRRATLDDVDALMKIEKGSGYPLPQYRWDRSHYRKFIKEEIVFVAIAEEPIGFVLLKKEFLDGAVIDSINILREYHGKGVAESLLKKAEESVDKRLYARCWNMNFQAIGFYTKNKFSVIEVRKRRYSGGETELVLCKEL